MKFKKRYLATLSIPLVSLVFAMQPLAYTGTGSNAKDPNTWNQSDQNQVATFGPQNIDWRQASCMIQSATFLKVKTGSAPIGYAPWDLKKELDSYNGYASSGYLSYNKVDWGNDWVIEKNGEEHGMIGATYQDIFKYYEQGYVMVIRVISPAGPHMIAVDYIDEQGNIYIFDSGFRGQKFSDTYSPSSVTDVMLLKSKSGKKGKDLPHVIGNPAGQQLYAQVEKEGTYALTAKDVEKAKAQEKTKENEKKVADAKKADARLKMITRIKEAKREGNKAKLASIFNEVQNDEYKDEYIKLIQQKDA